VAYHRGDQLERLLGTLEDDRLEIVVVNVEADPDVASTAEAAGVKHMPVDDNVGFAAAVNVGIASCASSAVVFANDDVALTADQVLTLARRSEVTGDVVVPQMLDRDGVPEPTVFALPTPVTLLTEWVLLPDAPVPFLARRVRLQKWRRPEASEPIQAAAASVVAAPRSVLLRDPLPEHYFLYWEEAEWFWRLRERGVKVTYEASVQVLHRGGRTDVRALKSRLLARNAIRCVRRTQGRRAAVAAWPVVVLWQIRLVLMSLLRSGLGRRRTPELPARLAGLGAALAGWREIA
jgi:GT2 family glycosyltransferase